MVETALRESIKIFFSAALTVAGGAVPIWLLLLWYSCKEKARLNQQIKLARERIKDREIERKTAENEAQNVAKASKLVAAVSGDPAPDLRSIEAWNKWVYAMMEKDIAIAELEDFIEWAEGYDFWATLESLIERQYVGSKIGERFAKLSSQKTP